MKNFECRSIEDARDIQGVIAYRQALEAGAAEAEAVQRLNEASRDHSRNTMYWGRFCIWWIFRCFAMDSLPAAAGKECGRADAG